MRLSDKIAYINHDIDDAIRGGILREKRYSEEIYGCFGNFGERTPEHTRYIMLLSTVDRPVIQMSEEVHEAMQGLRVFMFENVYRNPVAKKEEGQSNPYDYQLYEFYIKNPEFLPNNHRIC